MCLAVPGRIERVEIDADGATMAMVSFGGIRKQVCLDYVEDARPGQYVIVHAGFAISMVDEEEAVRTLALLDEIAAQGEEGERSGGAGDAVRRRVP